VISGCKPGEEIHVILDNLSPYKTKQVEEFLEHNANVKLDHAMILRNNDL
jgi:hypothetical protein